MRRKAFTLLELLVVITVLMMLMGMLVPAVMRVRSTAVRKLAMTRLKGLCLAIERYYLQMGNYPPSTGFPPDDDKVFGGDADWETYDPDAGTLGKYSLYYYLCGPDGNGFIFGGRTYGPYRELDDSQYEEDGNGGRFILDPWGNPWLYQENRTQYMRVPRNLGWPAHKPKRYDILSMGPDGVMSAENLDFYRLTGTTGEEKDHDDITNSD